MTHAEKRQDVKIITLPWEIFVFPEIRHTSQSGIYFLGFVETKYGSVSELDGTNCNQFLSQQTPSGY